MRRRAAPRRAAAQRCSTGWPALGRLRRARRHVARRRPARRAGWPRSRSPAAGRRRRQARRARWWRPPGTVARARLARRARPGALAPDRFGHPARSTAAPRARRAGAVAGGAARSALRRSSALARRVRRHRASPRELSALDSPRLGRRACPSRWCGFDAAAARRAARAGVVLGVVVPEVVLRGFVLPVARAAARRVAGDRRRPRSLGAASFSAIAGDGRLCCPRRPRPAALPSRPSRPGRSSPAPAARARLAGAALGISLGWAPARSPRSRRSAARRSWPASSSPWPAALARVAPASRCRAADAAAARRASAAVGSRSTMGILLIVALIVGALFAIGLQTQIAEPGRAGDLPHRRRRLRGPAGRGRQELPRQLVAPPRAARRSRSRS